MAAPAREWTENSTDPVMAGCSSELERSRARSKVRQQTPSNVHYTHLRNIHLCIRKWTFCDARSRPPQKVSEERLSQIEKSRGPLQELLLSGRVQPVRFERVKLPEYFTQASSEFIDRIHPTICDRSRSLSWLSGFVVICGPEFRQTSPKLRNQCISTPQIRCGWREAAFSRE